MHIKKEKKSNLQYTVYPNKYYELQLTLTCAFDVSTVIDYSLGVNGSGAVPSWVVLDSSTSSLKFTAPLIWTKTQYSFKVSSFVHGDSVTVLKVVNLTVEANPMWLVANCDKWVSDNPNYWSSCSSGYSKYFTDSP